MENKLFSTAFKILLLTTLLSTFSYAKHVDIDLLNSKASKEDKNVLLFFKMTHCPFCVKMKSKVFADQEISQLLQKHFIVLDINSDHKDNTYTFKKKKYTTDDFIANKEACIFPTQQFLDHTGKTIYTLVGYRGVKTFKDILSYIYTKSYNKFSLEDYLMELAFDRE